MSAADEPLSISAAAARLGVSRWQVWQMIADGRLDVEPSTWGGRVVTRVRLLDLDTLQDGDRLPKSQTTRLQEQVDKLTHTVEYLSALLIEVSGECVALRESAQHTPVLRETARREPAHRRLSPQPQIIPRGITARPNPMTHPSTALGFSAVLSREQALAPVEALLNDRTRRTGWWHRSRSAG